MAKRPKPRGGKVASRKSNASKPLRVNTPPAAVSPVANWPNVSPPPPRLGSGQAGGPAPEAVVEFERAMGSMQRHAYSEAAESFRRIAGTFPGERALLDRVKVYLDLCERELKRQPPTLRTVEERLTAATAALNNGDEDRADALARSVVNDDAEQDLAYYLLAAVAARRGASEEALSHLARSVALSPEAGAQARFDTDFESLRAHDDFRRLTDPSSLPTSSGARGLRRGRSER